MKDEKYVHSSRLYTMLNDQLQHWNTEVEKYKALTDCLQVKFPVIVLCVCRCFEYFSREFCLLNVYFQADRAVVMRREKELNLKVESAEAFRNINENVDSRIEELELQLQTCLIEKNDLEINMEEAVQDSGKIT